MFGAIIECRLLHASGTTTAGALIRFGVDGASRRRGAHRQRTRPRGGRRPARHPIRGLARKIQEGEQEREGGKRRGIRQGRVRAERRPTEEGRTGRPPLAAARRSPGSTRTAGRSWGAESTAASTPRRRVDANAPMANARARGARPERLRAHTSSSRGFSSRSKTRASRARAARADGARSRRGGVRSVPDRRFGAAVLRPPARAAAE